MTKEVEEVKDVEEVLVEVSISQEAKEICSSIIDDAAIGRFYEEVLKTGEDGRMYSEEPIWNDEHDFNTPELEDVYTEIRDKIDEDLNSVLGEVTLRVHEFYSEKDESGE